MLRFPAMKLVSATIVVTAIGLLGLESSALACIDAGAPNAACNDGGAEWISCKAHSDCPQPQLCFEGTCSCITKCPFGESCSGSACACIAMAPGCRWDIMSCHDRGRDTAITCSADAGTADAGTADAAGGGCAAGGRPPSGAGPITLGALVATVLLRRRRGGRAAR